MNQDFKKSYSVIFVLLLAAFLAGFYFGKSERPAGLFDGSSISQNQPADVDFSLFWDAWQTVQKDYIDQSKLKPPEMVWGAIGGMVKSLKDPYTIFLSPEENKKFSDDISGAFEGIGAEIGIKKGILVVVAPLEGTPAQKAGLLPSDRILKIDDKLTDDMTIDEAVSKIRGPKDTAVRLLISRDNWDQPKEVTVARATIQIPTIKWQMKEEKIAYLQLFHFTENVPSQFKKTVQEILSAGAKGIIFDLRNNPGGYLESAVEVSSWFLDKDQLVAAELFSDGTKKEYFSQGYAKLNDLPTVILINQGSASAAEIVAGALRDNRQLKLVGEKTFGKGSVQEIIGLKDKSSLKITIAKWLTPSGKSINEEGLNPDVEVKKTEQDEKDNLDPQLAKSLEIVKNLINNH